MKRNMIYKEKTLHNTLVAWLENMCLSAHKSTIRVKLTNLTRIGIYKR